MGQDHYRILGVAKNASAADIKSAYRRLVLAHHPDKNPSRESADIFLKATQAYEILGDPDRRKHFDTVSDGERRRAASGTQTGAAAPSGSRTQAQPRPQPAPPSGPKVATVAADVTRLTLIFTRGQFPESEKLARAILNRDSRQPIPYAVLGDLARAKGQLDEAAKMYAYAAQMDPRNPIYHQRHEELIRTGKVDKKLKVGVDDRAVVSAIVGGLLLVSTVLYVIVAKEPPLAPNLSLINTWTLGLLVMLFLGGVSMGAVLCSGNFIDRFSMSSTNSLGRVSSPIIALTSVAVVNFWAALALYGGISLAQRSYNVSHLRFVSGIAVVVLALAVASAGSQSPIQPLQTLTWGGNIAYLGGICGWMVADGFKKV